jgi:hypothetical protein
MDEKSCNPLVNGTKQLISDVLYRKKKRKKEKKGSMRGYCLVISMCKNGFRRAERTSEWVQLGRVG